MTATSPQRTRRERLRWAGAAVSPPCLPSRRSFPHLSFPGTSFFPYLIDPLAAIQYRARKEHIESVSSSLLSTMLRRLTERRVSLAWILDDYNLEEAARQAKNKQVALVFITADSGEGEPPV